MHDEALPAGSRKTLECLESSRDPALGGWVLAGGTGLALQLGHRVSDDFVFFRCDGLGPLGLHEVFRSLGSYETLQEAEHTLTVLFNQTKLPFFTIRDPFLFEALPYRFFRLADTRDIALMKMAAISARGSRKDFVDLFVLLAGGLTLSECLAWMPQKYGAARVNRFHLLKSLTYFEDAEQEPMPRLLKPLSWDACKQFFIQAVHEMVLPPSDE